jgi:hypothetical protein
MLKLMPDRDLWCSRRRAAVILDVSPRHFDEAIRPRLPDQAIAGAGRDLRFYVPALVQTIVGYRVEQAKPPADEEEALLMGGGSDSPSLERLRAATADIKERQRDEMDRQLVKVDDVVDALAPAVSIFRSAGERARRQFGNEVGDFYNETAEDVCAEFDRVRANLNGTVKRQPERHQKATARQNAKRPAPHLV